MPVFRLTLSLSSWIVLVFCIGLASFPASAQEIETELDHLEMLQKKGAFPELYARFQNLSTRMSKAPQSLSPPDQLRYQTLHLAYLGSLGELDRALAIADSVEQLASLRGIPSEAWANFYFQKGEIYLFTEDFLKSSIQYERAIELFERQAQPDFRVLALAHNNLGYSYDILGFQNKSKESYYRAFEIWKVNYLEDFSNISTVLNNLIFSEVEYGDLEAAADLLAFFEKYVQQAKKNELLAEEDALYLESKLLLNYSRYYGTTQNATELDQVVTRAELFFSHAPRAFYDSEWPVLASIYEEAGFLQKELKDFAESEQYYRRMLRLPLNGFYQMKFHANVAITHYDAGENERSLDFARKSLELFEKYGFGGTSSYSLKILQADLLSRLGRDNESIQRVESMLTEMLGRRIGELDIPELRYADFGKINNDRYLVVLIKAGGIFQKRFSGTHSPSDFAASMALYRAAGEMFQEYYVKGSYNQELEELSHQIEEGILSLWTLSERMTLEEKTQLLALLEQNQSQQGWKKFLSKNEDFLGSTSVMLREQNLKNLEITQGQNSEAELQGLTRELAQIEKRIQQEASYRFFAGEDFDLEAFQRQLQAETSVLKYFATDSRVFALLIQKEGLQVFPLGDLGMVRNWSEELLASLRKMDESYREPAQVLYKLILAPFAGELSNRLFILPDDLLHSIPFEALIDEKGDFLLKHHTISYQQSFRQMAFQSPKQESKSAAFLGTFAPDYSGTAYQAIVNSQAEGKAITAALGGDFFGGESATKQSFVETFTDYQVHHLAMHGVQNASNHEESALIFSGGEKLLLRELYQMNFPSELVVLSACNTGVGQLVPGEGLMSLSKALSLAGVKSTVYSLWEVPDRETAALMIYFYENIKKGLPKDEALALSKRQFLAENPLKSHPTFWAGFVISGKTEALQAPDFTWREWMGWGGAGMLAVGVVMFLASRRKTAFTP